MSANPTNRRTLIEWLSAKDAAAYLKAFDEPFQGVGQRIGMDVDPLVLSSGHQGSGAGRFEGGRCDEVSLADSRGSVFIDGDLVVDGPIENDGGLIFVKGDLVGRSLYSSGYLIVAGDLRVERFLGEDEPLGTYVFGDASISSAVLTHNHHFDVWGDCVIDELVDGEEEGEAAVREGFARWGVVETGVDSNWLEAARRGLAAWARKQGKIADDE